MVHGAKGWLSLIVGILFLGQSLLPRFGFSWLTLGQYDIYVLILGLVLLLWDGFTEDGFLKGITLITGAVLAIFLATAYLPVSLPSFATAIYPWVVVVAGALLIIGAFART